MICKKIKDSLEWKDKPNCNHVAPAKCMLDIILSIDTKEVSTIHRMILGKNRSTIEKACHNWNEKFGNLLLQKILLST